MPTVPGAIGAFRRQAVEEVGGLTDDTLAEDTDLTMALCRAGWRVVYEETAVAWTEAPSTLRLYWRQRYRWCYGTMQAMWKHRRAAVRARSERPLRPPRPALPGRLPRAAAAVRARRRHLRPVRDLRPQHAGSHPACGSRSRPSRSWPGRSALWMDGESTWAIWTLPLQQFVYRQLLYMVVMQSLITVVLGARLRWHAMRRIGTFTGAGATPS